MVTSWPLQPKDQRRINRWSCFQRANCWKACHENVQEERLGSNQVVLVPATPPAQGPPPGKGKGKGKGKGPAPAAPKCSAKAKAARRSSAPPAWRGPLPSEGCQPQRKVNWNPIRQQELLEGSVWQRVNQKIDERGNTLLKQETLDKAFLQPAAKAKARGKSKSLADLSAVRRSRTHKNERRVLPNKEAFIADVLYAQLVKHGLSKLEHLHWILGTPQALRAASGAKPSAQVSEAPTQSFSASSVSSCSSGSSGSSSSSGGSDSESNSDGSEGSEDESEDDPQTLTEDSLQTLINFLRLGDGIEAQLKQAAVENSEVPLAQPEKLLQQLLTKVGPGKLLQSRVEATLSATKFFKEADDLERTMRGGIHAAGRVVNSTAIPILLEGVLVLGNYVNSTSNALGSAAGVSLDSVAKLGHTRPQDSNFKGPQNALCLIVRQLQVTQDPEWLVTLVRELEGCKEACDLDCGGASGCLKSLTAKIFSIQACWHPYACFQAKLQKLLQRAIPQLETLRALEQELQSVTITMRKYFAEPATTSLSSMLTSLASLLEFLPKPDDLGAAGVTPRKAESEEYKIA